ncbi:unnamed protein product [Kuraishia capsulata CBS 1993]|uniref:Probable metalloprotease ARX1 n=1 Tax=Kuraishia capsulata CBS 1993 TaxID=1382522 RepID=W6MSK8_9ASCO|nr:uncharacterized protein KUCA_T00005692001 [Kuraishia capsulata CBS 1993]CDK29699.1 unnamed protein product [Kuraishia capsulata CBS 1993]
MELAITQEDANILLKQKNLLNESVLEKYRLAGQISQTCLAYLTSLINSSYHLGTHEPYSVSELCILGDSYIERSLRTVFKKGANAVREKGIALPVTFEINDIVAGFSPELLDEDALVFQPGDIVTISLGCHVDGYTANVSHTLVIYPPGQAPAGPLLGPKADAVCAAHIATETVVAILAGSLMPEKLPRSLKSGDNTVTGSILRSVVDSIAESFNCTVVPTSKIRRIRRFLAGQAEGVVAEKEFKGVVWSEADQELKLLEESSTNTELTTYEPKSVSASETAIPSDKIIISAGEVYLVDLKMAPLADFADHGIVSLQTVDAFSGKNHSKDSPSTRPSIYLRELATQKTSFRLKSARKLWNQLDKELSVYPFKLAYTSSHFPLQLNGNLDAQLAEIKHEIQRTKVGANELVNSNSVVTRPIQRARFLPLQVVLNSSNLTGSTGFDAETPVLPGLEIPLPRLNISSLMVKNLMKQSLAIPVAREATTVVLVPAEATSTGIPELLRLTGGSQVANASWVHSERALAGEYVGAIGELVQLSQDARFGLKIRECQPMKLDNLVQSTLNNEVEMMD